MFYFNHKCLPEWQEILLCTIEQTEKKFPPRIYFDINTYKTASIMFELPRGNPIIYTYSAQHVHKQKH